jgi:hypothetical protein
MTLVLSLIIVTLFSFYLARRFMWEPPIWQTFSELDQVLPYGDESEIRLRQSVSKRTVLSTSPTIELTSGNYRVYYTHEPKNDTFVEIIGIYTRNRRELFFAFMRGEIIYLNNRGDDKGAAWPQLDARDYNHFTDLIDRVRKAIEIEKKTINV